MKKRRQSRKELNDDGVEKVDHSDIDSVQTARNAGESLENEAAGENSEIVQSNQEHNGHRYPQRVRNPPARFGSSVNQAIPDRSDEVSHIATFKIMTFTMSL